MEHSVHIEGVSFNHAGEHALQDVGFSVPKGALFGMIGADGAGKSTLFRLLSTLLPIQKGVVQILGLDVQRDYRQIRASIGYMPQRFSLYPDLTVHENLRFAAEIMDIPHKQIKSRLEELIAFSRLEGAVSRRAGRLSGGMKQKLALCCAMVRRPKLLLLDEPTVGVDPVTRKDFWDMLAVLRSQGTTTLVSTPYMDEAELCDEVLLLHEGRILGKGSPKALCAPLQGRLWKIHGEKTLHVRADISVQAPIESLYAMGGDLNVLVALGEEPRVVLEAVQKHCVDAMGIEPAQAKVEDILLLALKQKAVGS